LLFRGNLICYLRLCRRQIRSLPFAKFPVEMPSGISTH
jgi:hypothetical protein